LLGSSGFVSSHFCVRRKLPSGNGSDQESQQSEPIFEVGNVKGTDRRQKKEVEARYSEQRSQDSRSRSPGSSQKKNDE
jgi:hypothetical protein